MLDIDTLLNFYEERLWAQPPPSELPIRDVVLATIGYLNGYKHLKLMLKTLGEGDEPLKKVEVPK